MSDVREAGDDVVLTPRIGTLLRRSLFWVAIVTILALIALVGLLAGGSLSDTDELLGADNEKPDGARALVQVLEDEGVRVTAVTSVDDAEGAVRDPADTTVLLYDYGYNLDPDDIDRVARLADRLVIIDPDAGVLAELAPGVESAGYLRGAVEDECRVGGARDAQEISADGAGYVVTDDDLEARTCFTDGDEGASLVRFERDGVEVVLLGATEALRNDRILENDNAALGLGLLGATDDLVWLQPAYVAPASESGAPVLPGWVLPLALPSFLVVIAAGVWQGRRFGPLIVENLPVAVRASETMHGRARLYAKSSARLHALDALRIGTVDRLARLCGLATLATVDEVIGATAAVTRRAVPEIRHLLVDAVPTTDAELVALSDALLLLEQAATAAIRPQGQ